MKILSFSKKFIALFLSFLIIQSGFILPVKAETYSPTPDDVVSEDKNIILHKQAERIAADEWRINVSATIKDQPVTPPTLEVTFVLDASGSMNLCAEEELHNNHFMHYHYWCNLICTEDHTHLNKCYDCGILEQSHNATTKSCTYVDDEGNKQEFTSRFEIAKEVIEKMANSLPEGTRVGKVAFNFNGLAKIVSSFDTVTPEGSTYMMEGVRLALDTSLSNSCFSTDPTTQKILIIVTDGAASDNDYGASDPAFKAFKDAGGIVYTVGFNHHDANLQSMISEDGSYSEASNPDELAIIFDVITLKLTAMLIDPMGPAVGFVNTSVEEGFDSVNGDITYDNSSSTLYWNPSNYTDISGSKIEYNYTVKISNNAENFTPGIHSNVALNKPTYLLYGLSSDLGGEMHKLYFPIPHVEYGISTIQVKQVCGETEISSTEVETVICDYPGAAFKTDYQTIEPVVYHNGTDYYYEETVILENGQETDSVEISSAAAYVVIHKYSEEERYSVDYEFVGDVPENAPDADSYDVFGVASGETITLPVPSIPGYIFSGWTVSEGEATVNNGSFEMPEGNVKFIGRWTKLNGYKVLVNYYTSVNGKDYVKDNAEAIVLVDETLISDNSVSVDFSSALTWNRNEYGKPVASEGSVNGNILTLSPADPSTVVTVSLYREVKTKANVTVHYVDEDGNKLREDSVSENIFFGDDYDVSFAKEITRITKDGKVYDFLSDGNASYTGKMDEDGIEITRVYKKHRFFRPSYDSFEHIEEYNPSTGARGPELLISGFAALAVVSVTASFGKKHRK